MKLGFPGQNDFVFLRLNKKKPFLVFTFDGMAAIIKLKKKNRDGAGQNMLWLTLRVTFNRFLFETLFRSQVLHVCVCVCVSGTSYSNPFDTGPGICHSWLQTLFSPDKTVLLGDFVMARSVICRTTNEELKVTTKRLILNWNKGKILLIFTNTKN